MWIRLQVYFTLKKLKLELVDYVFQKACFTTLFISANIFAKYKSFTLSISLLQIFSNFTAQFDLQTCQIHNLLGSWPRNCPDVYFKDFCTSPNMENVE